MAASTASHILKLLQEKKMMLCLAESCTGGMISAAVTDIPGAGHAFDRGFVTYSNESKMECLGVRKSTLETYGAVSAQTACEMAEGALRNSNASIALSVTGLAGPDGGSENKPVGLVFFGCAVKDSDTDIIEKLFEGSREAVRSQTKDTAFDILLKRLLS